jgi:hypothetical protein
MHRVLLSVFAALLLSIPAVPPASADGCEFNLGFKALHDAIPNEVGNCTSGESHNPTNGDGLQNTTAWHGKGGLLVWRKFDNWTAFTDGANTWINGPNGVQKRPNAERFAWEMDPVPPSAPTPSPYSTIYLLMPSYQRMAEPYVARGVVPRCRVLSPYAADPDHAYYIPGFEPGGWMEQLTKMGGAKHDAEQYRIRVVPVQCGK